MRAFLMACVVFIAIGAGGYFTLNAMQKPTGTEYTTGGARIDPSWSWRIATTTSKAEPCAPRESWQWFFVDFRHPRGEPGLCSDSQ